MVTKIRTMKMVHAVTALLVIASAACATEQVLASHGEFDYSIAVEGGNPAWVPSLVQRVGNQVRIVFHGDVPGGLAVWLDGRKVVIPDHGPAGELSFQPFGVAKLARNDSELVVIRRGRRNGK